MTDTDRQLVAALRADLAAFDPIRACDRAAERAGLAPSVTEGPAPPLVSRAWEPAIARLEVRLGAPAGVDSRAMAEARRMATDPIVWAGLAEHCRLAWLRGRFLGHGSLSLAAGRTHLEFVVAPDEAPILADRLGELDLPASWRLRRGRGVVTWKSAETVTTFLGRIGAGPGLLELEARQVSRALRGELNRVLNAESSNVARSVVAAGRQLAAIAELEGDGRLGREPDTVRAVAAARREAPDATLTELATRLGLHRSAVQRALERLERLAGGGPGPMSREPATPLA